MLACRQQNGGVAVPQVMETDARQVGRLEQRVELAPDVALIERRANRAREDEAPLSPQRPRQQPFAVLLRSPLRQGESFGILTVSTVRSFRLRPCA
jgi:hypothetical protein